VGLALRDGNAWPMLGFSGWKHTLFMSSNDASGRALSDGTESRKIFDEKNKKTVKNQSKMK